MNSRKLFQPLIHPFQGGDSVVKRLEQTNLAASKLVHDLFHHLQLRLFLLAKHAGPVQKENLEALNRGLSLATQRANRFLDFTSDRSGKLESLDLAAFRSERGLDPHYLFYCYTCGPGEGGEIDGGGLRSPYSWTIWRPRSWPALPPGLSSIRIKLRFLFRWAVHRLHLFAGSGCGVLLVYERGELVHYSGFTPGYWRFPFVVGEDFQIGDTCRGSRKRVRTLRGAGDRKNAREARSPAVVRRRGHQRVIHSGCGKSEIHTRWRRYMG
jgi:hypothetical protein